MKPLLKSRGNARQHSNGLAIRRLVLAGIALLGIVATVWFVNTTQAAKQSQRDQRFADGWRSQSISEPKSSLTAIAAQWSMRDERSSDGRSLSWSVSDLGELRASLLALDGASVTVQKINVNKRDSALVVVAEIAP